MAAILSLLYAVLAYLFFVATFVYAIGFVGNVAVPRSIDVGPQSPLWQALAIDLALLSLFAVQHSVMARRSFKAWWTRYVPWTIERSTFVLAASLALALLLWQWRPIPSPVVWNVTDPLGAKVLWAIFWLGWVVLFVSTFLINHFELFGLQQALGAFTGQEWKPQQFRTPLFYRYVRHPIYVGFLMGFWAIPVMTAGHLLFAIATTGYILIGIWFEERDLIAQFGDRYRAYRQQVGMLVPTLRSLLPGEREKMP
jgi:protein-S-isoprenylcysteine O-methyltransferase Ste14